MSCSRFHVLLSQNLDGRLSSSRREALLDHLADCAACSRLADEMRAAQDLALRLPPQRVGPGFHETLWQRVEAGEGTPAAVFAESVPIGKRILYAASGAAAAALLLIALDVLAVRPDPVGPAPETRALAHVGRVDADESALAASAAKSERDFTAAFGEPETLHPAVVAQQARLATLHGVNELRVRGPNLRAKFATEPARARRELDQELRELRGAVTTLRWLADDHFIALPTDMHAELRVAERGIRRLETASNADELAVALEVLSEIDAEHLEQRFSIVCCDTMPAFLERLCDQLVQNPDSRHVLRLALPDGATLHFAPGPTNPLERVIVLPGQRR